MKELGRVGGKWYVSSGVLATVLLTSLVTFAQSDTADVKSSGSGNKGQEKSVLDLSERKAEVRANIELWEERVRKKFAVIERIKSLDLKKIETQRVGIQKLKEVLDDLNEEAGAILKAHSEVGPDLKNYRRALLQAPDVFRKIADQLDERAVGSKSSILKSAYADIAQESRTLATTYEGKSKGIDGLEAELAKKMEVVKESQEFVKEVRSFLDAIPVEHGLETERLLSRVNTYIEVLQESIKALKGVTEQIGEPTPPSTDPNSKKKNSSLTNANPLPAAIDAAEFKTRIAALRN